MTDSTKIILIVGVILIATGYVLLYTPLADILFVPKPKIPQPVRPVISMPRTFIPGTQEVVRKPETSEAEKAAPNIVATAEATVPKFTTLRDPFDTDFAYVRAAVAPGTAADP